jgi:hypothetical protein
LKLVIAYINCFVQPLGALACQIGKAKSRCEFDHAGVVVVKRGRPFVAEETFSGIKVRNCTMVCAGVERGVVNTPRRSVRTMSVST